MTDTQRARITRWLNTTGLPLPEFARSALLAGLVGRRLTEMGLPFREARLRLDLTDAMQSNLYLDQVWEPILSNWAAFFAARAQVIADVGAHIGYFTVLMARYAPPGAVVHAFEPDPRARERLEQNVALNGLTARLNPMAVMASGGTREFSLPRSLRLGTGRFGRLLYTDRLAIVETTTLDQYCEREGLPRIDLIKMDIEGGEVEALEGMRAGLRAGRYPILLVEFHQELLGPDKSQAVLDQLRDAGYHVFEVHPDRLRAAQAIATPHFCALDPEAFRDLASPPGQFCLPPEAQLPFPLSGDKPG